MRRLLIRPGAIGDCIVSLPALEYLRAEYTEVWAPTPVVPLIQFADAVRPISSTGLNLVGLGNSEFDLALKPRLENFDEIRSWYGANRPEFRSIMESFGVPCTFYQALPSPGTGCHATDFYASQVGAPLGSVLRLRVFPSPWRGSVTIHPFSGSAKKNWPLANFQTLVAYMGHDVDWIAGPEERLPGARTIMDLLELASFIAGASLYVGNDSGITHLAAAAGVPTLALFGATPPEVWAPRGSNVTVLYESQIEQLSVDRVLCAANRLLGLR